VDGESEFDDEPLEEDELISLSDAGDALVRAQAVAVFSRVCLEHALQAQPDSSEIKKLATAAERKEKIKELLIPFVT
jgi:hypothetical protein